MLTNFAAKSRQSIPRLLSGHAANERSEASSYLAIYVWCRRTDELVDGPGAITTPETLDRWEAQLESLFAGRPFDDLDVAFGRYPRTLPIGYSALSGYDCRSTNGMKSLRDV